MALELEGLIARLLLVISCAGEQGMFLYSATLFLPVIGIKIVVPAHFRYFLYTRHGLLMLIA